MTLNEVLKNTNYDVSLFSEEARKFIEEAIVVKTTRGKETPFITCMMRYTLLKSDNYQVCISHQNNVKYNLPNRT